MPRVARHEIGEHFHGILELIIGNISSGEFVYGVGLDAFIALFVKTDCLLQPLDGTFHVLFLDLDLAEEEGDAGHMAQLVIRVELQYFCQVSPCLVRLGEINKGLCKFQMGFNVKVVLFNPVKEPFKLEDGV